MAARARLALELSLPASIRAPRSLAGRDGSSSVVEERGGSDLPRMGSRPGGCVCVFLYIATSHPAAKWIIRLGWTGYLVTGLIRARDMGRSGPASFTSTPISPFPGCLSSTARVFLGNILVWVRNRFINTPISVSALLCLV